MKEEIEAGAELIRAFDAYAPVRAAFWMKVPDEYMRYLYIAYDQIDGKTTYDGYGEVVRLLRAMDSEYLDTYPIKLIASNDPLAKDAIKVQQTLPRRSGHRLWDTPFGDRFADDVYVYPNPLPVAVS